MKDSKIGTSTFRSEDGNTRWNKLVFVVVAVIGAACFVGAAWAFTAVAPEPYMDEVFHVPMTEAYCKRDFGRWDPKITTPPGLYVSALAYAHLASAIKVVLSWTGGTGIQLEEDDDGKLLCCAATVLRQTNWVFSLGTLAIMRMFLRRRMPPGKAWAHAILLWLYPVSFFFSFLLYTDPGATFFFLLCYLLATGRPSGGSWGRRIGSAAAGGIAIAFRQTNAVWVAFVLAVCLLDDFSPLVNSPATATFITTSTDKKNDDVVVSTSSRTRERHKIPTVVQLFRRLIRAALRDAVKGAPLLRTRLPLAVPVLLFAVFVWGFNEGAIALGDKENHSPGGPPHLAQLAYFAAVCASLWGFVGSESAVGREARTGAFVWAKRIGLFSCLSTVCAVAFGLSRYSLAHAFLLSDNRHYTFYIWRRLLKRPVLRSALAPAYTFCGWLVSSRLLERKNVLWLWTFTGAIAVVLVPSPLLEPRYLTVPVLLAHLESRERTWRSLLVGVVICVLVNAGTIFVFLFRPFAWHDGSVARFMW